MKANQNFGLMYILLAVIQILICNYCQFTPYMTFSILPVMTLCMPLSVGTTAGMLAAFATGLSVDWLAEGIPGLNVLALVPVAATRKFTIQTVFGKDHIIRQENISFGKNGFLKMSVAIILSQALFLIVYIIADGAGTRPFWFNAARFALSLAAGYLLSLPIANTLLSKDRKL